ncbi:GNAT family N-acetyltransferase [Flagellimonas lutimaris]|uniref:GNAT family N-acetyltransferase n=1 Tax=Flagellimonas lutimaris TaxID=475082 RepID=UPI003F5CDEE3
MNKKIVEHLFEFWEQIGRHGGFLKAENGFSLTNPQHNSWPNKIFNLNISELELSELQKRIRSQELPNSIAIFEDNVIKNELERNGFCPTSQVKAMALDTSEVHFDPIDASEFIRVSSRLEAELFAQAATESFGYTVSASTISALINKPSFTLVLGKHENAFPSCGMVYLDKNGVSGIHMIGTKAGYRGLGLGKKMTRFLIHQAIKNQSSKVYLVASQAGERIYTKMGFTTHGVLESYSLSLH